MLPLLSTEFDVSLGDASLVITVFSVAYGLAQLFFGPLGDRYGKYFVIACVSLASALTSALCALAPGFESLLVARLFARVTAFAFIASHMYRTFGFSLAAAGALIVLYGMGGFVFALASARMVRSLGEIGLVRWGGLLVTVSLAAIGIAPFWWWAIPACLVAGLGFYMLHNTLQINATQMAPERRGAAVSTFSSCFFLGQSVGVGVAGLLVEHIGTAIIMLAGACGVLAIALRFGAALTARAAEDLS